MRYITSLCSESDCFISAGRVQVTTQADREEEARQNQRMHRPAERFITRTSEAIGETAAPLKVLRRLFRPAFARKKCPDSGFVPPQTLGHLEKAVVLELTLKHLNALTAVTEQQHQKIIALQNGKVHEPRISIAYM